jgi:hypothetical protein
MNIKTFATAAAFAAAAIITGTSAASAGGNYYGSPYYGSYHSHIQLGPADASEDFRAYDRRACRWLKERAMDTGYKRHWRAYRRCVRG